MASAEGAKSIPDVSFIVIYPVSFEELAILILKSDPLMMKFLPGNVAL